GYLAAVYNQGIMIPPVAGTTGLDNPEIKTTLRAQTIATYDYIKRELPDVFFIDPNFAGNVGSYNGPYPFNFTGVPYYPNGNQVDPNMTGLTSFMLPLGHMVQGPFIATNGGYGDSYIDPN